MTTTHHDTLLIQTVFRPGETVWLGLLADAMTQREVADSDYARIPCVFGEVEGSVAIVWPPELRFPAAHDAYEVQGIGVYHTDHGGHCLYVFDAPPARFNPADVSAS